MRPLFLVGHVLSWRKRYVQNYVFAFCACGWGLVLSTKLLAGKVYFYVFMFFENKPVDTLLGIPATIYDWILSWQAKNKLIPGMFSNS